MKKLLYLLLLLPFISRAQTISISTPHDTVCNSSFVTFKAATSGITAPHYHWQINGASFGTDSIKFTTNVLASLDTITCDVTNPAGDTVWATSNKIGMTIEVMPVVLPITGTDTIVCVGATVTFSDATAGGYWAEHGGHASISDGVLTGISATGSYYHAPPDTVFYILLNSCGSDTATKLVTVQDKPYAVYFSAPTSICIGETAIIDDFYFPVSSAYGFISPSECLGGDRTCITGIKEGKDYISRGETNACGSSSYGQWVTVLKNTTISYLSTPKNICAGDSVSIADSTDGYSNTWQSNNKNAVVNANGVVTGVDPGVAYITLTSTGRCGKASKTTSLTILPPGHIKPFDSTCLGNSITLTDTTTGGTWHSSDPAIASITASGVLTALQTGFVSVNYSLGSCTVTKTLKIKDKMPPVSGQQTVCRGATIQLKNALEKGKWLTADSSMAVVDSTGKVTTKGTGNVTITYSIDGCSATLPINLYQLKLLNGPMDICMGKQIKLPYDGRSTWDTKNHDIAKISAYEDTLTGLHKGITTLSYRVDSGCVDTCILRVIDCTEPVALLPNPAKNELMVHADKDTYYALSVMNSGGQVLLRKQQITGDFTRIDVQLLAPGEYFILLYGYSEKNFTARFMKE